MKALVWHGNSDIRIDEVPEPECRDGQAIIEVRHAGICGSDLTISAGKHPRSRPPLILGHEFSGVIVERKGNVYPDFKKGDRVVVDPSYYCGQCELCRSGNYHICHKKGLYGVDSDGAFARFVAVSLGNLHQLPGKVSFEEGAMVEPLAVAVRAVGISKLMFGEYVVVLGGGPIGLLVAQVARVAGAAKVIMIEPLEFRSKIAEKMGFTVLTPDQASLEKMAAITGGYGIDVVYDAAGAAPAARLSTQLVKRTGRIIIVAVYKESAPFDLSTVSYGELQIFGTCIYIHKDFIKAVALVENGKVELNPLITHRLPLAEGVKAMDSLKKGENAQKILLAVS